MRYVRFVLLCGIVALSAACATPTGPRLSAETAIQLATTAARQAHVDFSTLLPPTAKFYPRSEIGAHWSVFWEEKPDKNGMVTVGGNFSAMVDDSTGRVDLIPGR
jgi:hypothetical protein